MEENTHYAIFPCSWEHAQGVVIQRLQQHLRSLTKPLQFKYLLETSVVSVKLFYFNSGAGSDLMILSGLIPDKAILSFYKSN